MRTVALLLSVVVFFLVLSIGCTQPATSPVPTAVPALSPATTPTTPAGPAAIVPSQVSTSLPATANPTPPVNSSSQGVWVRIVTEGRYAGTVGTEGSLREVSGTGEHFYQVPAASTGVVDVYLKNKDSSGRIMSVEVYNNGEKIDQKSTRIPEGTVVMAVDLKAAQLPRPTLTVTPNVTLLQPTPTGQGLSQVRQAVARVPAPQVISLSCNPQQEKVVVMKLKDRDISEMRDVEIANCPMGMLLPDIVGNPEYGLNGSQNSRLTGFSDGEYKKVQREATENQGPVNNCIGAITTPYWDWIECKAMLQQGGSQPETYDITFSAVYKGQNIPVRISVDTLNAGQLYPYMVYIPIQTDQAKDITNYEFAFVPHAASA